MDEFESYLIENSIAWLNSDLAGHFTWAPFGKSIKTSVENYIRRIWEFQHFEEIEAPIILSDHMWEKSGHLENFSYEMMKTESHRHPSSLRPETATSTYMNYDRLVTHNKNKFPIRVYQIGKVFRNEISTKFISRSREFTQAECQVFLTLKIDQSILFKQLLDDTFKLLADIIPEERIRMVRHEENNRAFYALDAYDFEIDIPFKGWTEVVGVHDRGLHDLKKVKVLEVAIGIDRLVYSLLAIYYQSNSNKEIKSIVKLPYILCPIKACVMPLVKKQPLVDLAVEIYDKLRCRWKVVYRDKKSIGARYMQNALDCIPYSITIDLKSLEDATVTIRDRDTEVQTRINISDISEYIQ